MFAVLILQLVLTVLTAANLDIFPNSGNEEVGLSLYRDGRFFPGLIIDTYWCGRGNVSRQPNELGPNVEVDSCCFAHDHCAIHVEKGETKYGRTNKGEYAQVSCHCDDVFFKCLQLVNSWSAWLVINTYAAIRPKCIESHFERLCTSPEGNYNLNPCAGYRCANTNTNNCQIFEKFVEFDSKFKTYQLEKDREEANIKNQEQNRMMFHPSAILV